MITREPTKEMLEEWKSIWEEYRCNFTMLLQFIVTFVKYIIA